MPHFLAHWPLAEHFGLATGQVKLAHAWLQAAHLAQEHELFMGKGVENAMVGFGNFVKCERHRAGTSWESIPI
jgi:hypothetical protein